MLMIIRSNILELVNKLFQNQDETSISLDM